jgi:hypothetical protein
MDYSNCCSLVGDSTDLQVLAKHLVNPATNYCYCCCFFLFVIRGKVKDIIQHHTLGSLSCPSTDVYTHT